jgi:hypothetical protein
MRKEIGGHIMHETQIVGAASASESILGMNARTQMTPRAPSSRRKAGGAGPIRREPQMSGASANKSKRRVQKYAGDDGYCAARPSPDGSRVKPT